MKVTKHLTWILLISSICLSLPAFAQNGFKWEVKLPKEIRSNYILGMKFDKNDHLWLNSFGTLSMYDGTNWTTFDTSIVNPAPRGWVIAPDFNSGDVWVGKSGLYRYDGTKWFQYTTANSGLSSDKVNDLCFANSTLWVATDSGLCKYDGSSWTIYTAANSAIPSNSVGGVKADHRGGVWMQSGSKLTHLSASGAWKSYADSGHRLVEVDEEGVPWTGRWDRGPSQPAPIFYRLDNGTLVPANNTYSPCSIDLAMTTVSPFSVASDTAGHIWLNAVPNLVHAHNGTLEGFNYLGDEEYTEWSASSGNVGIAVDSKGKIWFGYSPASWPKGYLKDTGFYSLDVSKYNPVKASPSDYGGWFANLDINKVAAKNLSSSGDMFWNLKSNTTPGNLSGYEVPKGSCHKATFADALWIGGMENGNLHLAAMTYRQTGMDYWPGPLDTTTAKGDTAQIRNWMQPWKLNRSTIEEFRRMYASGAVKAGTYTVPREILSWPAQGDPFKHQSQRLAPYVDVDKDGKYDPMKGDYPDIPGDQAVFSIFNDNSNVHTESGSDAMGIEVHSMAYAFNCDSIPENDSAQALNYTTFYRYEIINRSNKDYDSTYVGIWNSPQLGNYIDDGMGCKPKENYFYCFNEDNDDEGPFGYGKNPPMLSWVFLHSPAYDAANSPNLPLMNNVMYYNNDFTVRGNPQRGRDYYNYLTGSWRNDSLLTWGGKGYGGSTPTHFAFPDDPYKSGSTLWSWSNSGIATGYGATVGAAGPFKLKAGQTVTFEYAIVYSRDEEHPNGTNTSMRKNESYINSIKNWYYNHSFPQCTNTISGIQPRPAAAKMNVYPVPAHDQLLTDYVPKQSHCSYMVYNTQGQVVLEGSYRAGEKISLNGLSAGLYVLRILDGNQVMNTAFSKQ